MNILSENNYPRPMANDYDPIWECVIEDFMYHSNSCFEEELTELMEERNEFGIKKYQVPLQPFNGRNPVADLFCELLDAAAYCKQSLIERRDVDSNLHDVYIGILKQIEIVYMVYLENKAEEVVLKD